MMDSLSFFDNQQPRSANALLKELNLIQISDLFPSSLSFSAAQDYPTSPSSVENNSPTSNFNFSQAFPSELALASSSFIDPSPPPLYSSSKPIPVIQSEPSFPFSSSWPLEPTHNMMPTAPIPVGPELRFEWRLGGPDMFVKPVGLVVFRLKPEGSERFTDPLLLVADMHRNAIVVLNLAGRDFSFQ